MKTYTKEQLLKKYAGKYISIYPIYDYAERCWMYEVDGVSNTVRENFNLPEDSVVGD